MRRGALLLSIVMLTLGFAPAPLPRVERRPRPTNEIEGLWSGGISHDGKVPPENQKVRITADQMIYQADTRPFVYQMRLDATVRPATYHIKGIGGTISAGAEGRGIWRVQGDVLTISYNSVSQPLPTTFEGAGKGNIVEIYRRVGR